MFENPRGGRQARNFATNVPKMLDLKSSSEQIFSENCRWVPLKNQVCTYACCKVCKRFIDCLPSPHDYEVISLFLEDFTGSEEFFFLILDIEFLFFFMDSTPSELLTFVYVSKTLIITGPAQQFFKCGATGFTYV